MGTPSTATFGAGSGTSSDPARGPAHAAPAVEDQPIDGVGAPSMVSSSRSSENARAAVSAITDAVSAISAPAPVAAAVIPSGSVTTGALHQGRPERLCLALDHARPALRAPSPTSPPPRRDAVLRCVVPGG
eukprot:8644194-Alexandrium_andersonii.AAC.1